MITTTSNPTQHLNRPIKLSEHGQHAYGQLSGLRIAVALCNVTQILSSREERKGNGMSKKRSNGK